MREPIKGQLSSIELLLAYFAFFVVFTLAVSMWFSTVKDVNFGERERQFEDAANRLSEKLVKTGGFPTNWTSENVKVIGLADEPRILNRGKVGNFTRMMNYSNEDDCSSPIYKSYNCSKSLLGLGKYDFNLSIEDLDGKVIELGGVNLSTGRAPVNDTDQMTIIRSAILDDRIVRLRMTFWYQETGEA